jgi:3-methyl-2-oxobutanoate hydroxymethyltransferase
MLRQRAIERALVVVDLPFVLPVRPKRSIAFSHRIQVKESGGHAVKPEGGKEIKESIKKNTKCRYSRGVFGLTPQSIYKFGTYTVRAKRRRRSQKTDRRRHYEKNSFALVLEKIPAHLAEKSS